MKNLTKAMKGIDFELGRFSFHLNFAKTFVWGCDRDFGSFTERELKFLSFSVVSRDNIDARVLTIIVGPFKFLAAW